MGRLISYPCFLVVLSLIWRHLIFGRFILIHYAPTLHIQLLSELYLLLSFLICVSCCLFSTYFCSWQYMVCDVSGSTLWTWMTVSPKRWVIPFRFYFTFLPPNFATETWPKHACRLTNFRKHCAHWMIGYNLLNNNVNLKIIE